MLPPAMGSTAFLDELVRAMKSRNHSWDLRSRTPPGMAVWGVDMSFASLIVAVKNGKSKGESKIGEATLAEDAAEKHAGRADEFEGGRCGSVASLASLG